jgi:hypothetical protein
LSKRRHFSNFVCARTRNNCDKQQTAQSIYDITVDRHFVGRTFKRWGMSSKLEAEHVAKFTHANIACTDRYLTCILGVRDWRTIKSADEASFNSKGAIYFHDFWSFLQLIFSAFRPVCAARVSCKGTRSAHENPEAGLFSLDAVVHLSSGPQSVSNARAGTNRAANYLAFVLDQKVLISNVRLECTRSPCCSSVQISTLATSLLSTTLSCTKPLASRRLWVTRLIRSMAVWSSSRGLRLSIIRVSWFFTCEELSARSSRF